MRSHLWRLAAAGSFLALVACGSSPPAAPEAVAAPAPTASPTPPPPNVVLLLADDLGYGDLSAYGNTDVRMPAVDRLAAEGIRFTSFYTPSSVCQPSRAALMTGRYPVRTGVLWNSAPPLSHAELTLADLLRARGYRTAAVGKWHLGYEPGDMPVHYGFDSFSGVIQGSSASNEWIRGDERTGEYVSLGELGSRITREAVGVVRNHPGDRPLFLYVGQRLPHEPYLPVAPFAGASRAGIYGDVLEELDSGVAELLKAIQESKLSGNTLFLFLSDNGPAGLGSPGPLSGGKSSSREGGVRLPAIAWRPGRIPAGRVVDEITTTMDIAPTLVALAGGTLPADRVYDGMDISGLLEGRVDRLPGSGSDGRRELLFWLPAYDAAGNVLVNRAAIRSGRWKYHNWTHALHDLDSDPAESADVSRLYPEIATRLASRLFEIGP
jgi:arylsulfatase A-like enzyme